MSYNPFADTFDEMCTAKGEPREHWAYLFHSLLALGPDELEQRRLQVNRLLRDDGATYNVYDDPNGLNRPWRLDPVPMIIDSEEWSRIEAGLIERAELLSLILSDLYGGRHLIRKGLLPQELVFCHNGFLRACASIANYPSRPLVIYAADLIRSDDGHLQVLYDRTQAPSGLGYAMENRAVISQAFPTLLRESHPHRLGSFSRALRCGLLDLSAQTQNDPFIVVMTPGPMNETYFEQAYLANYLGFTLAEGSDMTVRDGKLWLRSLAGLAPVDVILRRVDDDFCDPLELRPDSRLGVAGMLEMVRRGSVSVANSLGAGVLENPALAALMPGIAKYFLGHELQLPSVASYWCGDQEGCAYVLDHLDELTILPLNWDTGGRPLAGNTLDNSERAELRARILAQPHLFVGRALVQGSSSPLLIDGELKPRRTMTRAYLVTQGDSFVVMPGGLTLAAADRDGLPMSNQSGAISKDTWVLASEPEKHVDIWLQTRAAAAAELSQESLSSHTAENLFWMGRYAERSEQIIRLLHAIFKRHSELMQTGDQCVLTCERSLLQGLTHVSATYPGFVGAHAQQRLEQPESELLEVVLNGNRVGTLASNLRSLLNAAYSVREMVSGDTWRVVNDIGDELDRLEAKVSADLTMLYEPLGRLITTLMALTGLTNESMLHGQGWRFLDIGRRIERALLSQALMRAMLVQVSTPEAEKPLLVSLLSATENQSMYKQRYRDPPQLSPLLDLLLLYEHNPRSINYQITAAQAHIAALPGQEAKPPAKPSTLITEAATLLRAAQIPDLLVCETSAARREALDNLLSRLADVLGSAAVAFSQRYFTHIQGPKQLVYEQLKDSA